MRKELVFAAMAIAAGFFTSADAEPLEVSVLEAPDSVWVSEKFVPSSRSEKAIAAFQVLRFEGGRVEESLLSASRVYSREPCETFLNCADSTNHVLLNTGQYVTDGATIRFTEVSEERFTTSRPDYDARLRSDALLSITDELQVRLDDGVLVLDHALLMRVPRRYVAMPTSALQEVVGIPVGLEMPFDAIGECALRGHHARISAPEGSLPPMAQSMVSYAELSAGMIASRLRVMELRRDLDASPPDQAAEIKAAIRRSEMAMNSVALTIWELTQRFAESGIPDDHPEVTNDTLKDIVHARIPAVATMPQDERERFWDEAIDKIRAAYAAFPAFEVLKTAQEHARQVGNDDAVMRLICP